MLKVSMLRYILKCFTASKLSVNQRTLTQTIRTPFFTSRYLGLFYVRLQPSPPSPRLFSLVSPLNFLCCLRYGHLSCFYFIEDLYQNVNRSTSQQQLEAQNWGKKCRSCSFDVGCVSQVPFSLHLPLRCFCVFVAFEQIKCLLKKLQTCIASCLVSCFPFRFSFFSCSQLKLKMLKCSFLSSWPFPVFRKFLGSQEFTAVTTSA